MLRVLGDTPVMMWVCAPVRSGKVGGWEEMEKIGGSVCCYCMYVSVCMARREKMISFVLAQTCLCLVCYAPYKLITIFCMHFNTFVTLQSSFEFLLILLSMHLIVLLHNILQSGFEFILIIAVYNYVSISWSPIRKKSFMLP